MTLYERHVEYTYTASMSDMFYALEIELSVKDLATLFSSETQDTKEIKHVATTLFPSL